VRAKKKVLETDANATDLQAASRASQPSTLRDGTGGLAVDEMRGKDTYVSCIAESCICRLSLVGASRRLEACLQFAKTRRLQS
jgi:hypothetical protein